MPAHTRQAMSETKTRDLIGPEANPLDGYSVAVQTCIDVCRGKSKSRLRLDAAAMLFEHCAQPPWVDWGIELDEDED